MAPSMIPLKKSSQTVPMPNVSPRAQVRSVTLILFVAMALLAVAEARVSDWVQSRFASMASRMGGLTKKPSSTGFHAVRMNPRIAPAQKIPVASRIGRAACRTCIGQVSPQNVAQLLDRGRSV